MTSATSPNPALSALVPACLLATLAALVPPASVAQEEDAPRKSLAHYNLEDGLAIGGYDPVAYFPEGGGEPTEGSKEIALTHAGVTYRFASKENRDRFAKDPAKYEPAYGGWCAYAMAKDDKVEVDEESFHIQGGRLYLFYDGFFNDTRKKWLKDGAGYQERADGFWSKLSGEDPARAARTRDVSRWNLSAKGLALGGHDPVSYHVKEGTAPVLGRPEHELVHLGVTYRFATPQTVAAFEKEPARYEPAYGGWCAFAMSKGERVVADPTAFLVQDGRLLVFYREGDTDARDGWREDPKGRMALADTEWKNLAVRK